MRWLGWLVMMVGSVGLAGCADRPTLSAGEAAGAGSAADAAHAGSGLAAGRSGSPAAAGATASAGSASPASAGSTTQEPPNAELDASRSTDAAPFVDASTSDAATGLLASCASAAFCDSFETSATLDTARWEQVAPSCSGNGTLAIDDVIAHGGTRSLRVQGGGGYCNHVFARPKAFAASDPLYVRFFVRFEQPLGAAHVSFAASHEASEDKDLRLGGQSEVVIWNRESDDATLPELSPTGIAASVKPAPMTWICVEGLIEQSGALHTFIDGTAIEGLSVEGEPSHDLDAQWQGKPDYHPQLNDLRLGWESYGDATNTLWFDDVVVGSQRLGCDGS